MTFQLGVVGLGTMGANLALNAARNGAEVVVFNRTQEKTKSFLMQHGKEGKISAAGSLAELVKALKAPRAVLLMVKAGDAVAQMIEELVPLLEKGDIIIDAGNSHDVDTMVRTKKLEREKGIHFLGMGVSGGEEGALNGPSMMPGGSKKAYDHLEPLLKKMAANDGAGGKCVTYIGPEGTGHFVKMVHNGIEYGIMQLLAETYHLLRVTGKSNAQIADIFEKWNEDPWLQSFLLEITVKILRKKDPDTGEDLVDIIRDQAEQKGTGKWTVNAALEYGVVVPTITAAVEARIVSSAKDFRVLQSKTPPVPAEASVPDAFVQKLQIAFEASVINTYAQGFQLLSVPSQANEWNLPMSEIARIWRGGCIIRASLLAHWQKMFTGDQAAAKLIRDRFSGDRQKGWREVIAFAVLRAIPVPALQASLTYFDAYRTERLPQNLIQAQRDFFGAHQYERLDREGKFHTSWSA